MEIIRKGVEEIMRKIKGITAVILAVALMIDPVCGSVLAGQTENTYTFLEETVGVAQAAEVTDDDPERERLGDSILPASAMGVSQYAIRKMSITGTSPFVADTIYFHSDVFAGRSIAHGIDVSRYQYDIDWQAAAAAGVEYAIIRAGYRGYGASGGMGADPYFEKNMEGAIMAGIEVGVYFFSQATTVEEAIEEAQYTLDKIAGYPVTLPVVLDFEYASVNGKAGGRLYDAKLSKEDATDVCLAFCDTIASAGYEPMLYANTVMLNNNLNTSAIDSVYKIWLANYTSMTAYTGTYDFWQYSSKGKISGISGNVDCNFWYQRPGEGSGGVLEPELPVVVETPVEQVTGLTSTDRSDTHIHLVWSPLTDVTGYEVYRYNSGTGIYDLIHRVENSTICTYTDTSLTPGMTYEYVVCGYRVNDSGTTYGSYSEVFAATTMPQRVSGFSAGSRTATRIRLNWEWVDEITGYCIYRYNVEEKAFEEVATLDSAITTWVDTNVKAGKEYDYIIKTYIKDDAGYVYWGSATDPITVKAAPAAVEGFSLTVARKDKIRLSWQPVEDADGYRIYRYDSKTKKYVKIKTIGSGETTTWVNKNLKSNTTYKYKIKAYVQETDGTRYTGAYGDTVTAKTKK